MSAFLPILSRWTHVVTAAFAIGGVFFLRVVIPIAVRAVDPEAARVVVARSRRVFKMTTHTAILLLLVTGLYNFILNLGQYKLADEKLAHALFGAHSLLGLIAFALWLWLLVKPEPPAGYMKWMAVTLGVLLVSVATASTLKYVREAPLRAEVAGR